MTTAREQFEYFSEGVGQEDIVDIMNRRGKDGWEAVIITYGFYGNRIYFKRRLHVSTGDARS